MNYQISIAQLDDIKEIAKLSMQSQKLHQEKEPTLFHKCKLPYNLEYIKKVIEDEAGVVFKAYNESKKIIGYIALYIYDCPKDFLSILNSDI